VGYVDERFGERHPMRGLILPVQAYYYWKEGRKEEFEKCLGEIEEFGRVLHSRRLFYDVFCLVRKMVVGGKVEVSERLVGLFENFGLSKEEMRRVLEEMRRQAGN